MSVAKASQLIQEGKAEDGMTLLEKLSADQKIVIQQVDTSSIQ